ncbi:MAG: hypothetical protein V1836_01600 [Candidatus Aenigmatarchaeota archaeon]
MKTKYGIISDIHRTVPTSIQFAIYAFKEMGVKKLIFNGDIIGSVNNISEQDYLAYLLGHTGDIGMETYVQPGSHEKVSDFEPVIKAFQTRYSNIIYTVENPKLETKDHHIVFLPGSDWAPNDAAGQGYHFGLGKKTGFYRTNTGITRMTNIEDLRKLITEPERTIVICHVPRKFDKPDSAVDTAYFGEATTDFSLKNSPIDMGSVFPGPIGEQLVQAGFPVIMKKENRGNEDLRTIYEDLGVRKSVSGHFHESAHRANDRNGNHVAEGELQNELFWNASYADEGRFGILTVDDCKASYENINFNKK